MENRIVWRAPGRGGAAKYVKLVLALLFGALLCTNAWASPGGHGPGFRGGVGYHGGAGYHGRGHSHGSVGLYFGTRSFWGPYGGGWYDDPWGYPGWGYPARTIILRPAPPAIYIERGAVAAQQSWYFCANPQGYYPYVKQCTSAWRTVPAQPPVQ